MKERKTTKNVINIILFLIIVYPIFTLAKNPEENKYPQLNTLEDKIIGISKLWSEIKYNFINVDLLEFDLDSFYYATIPKVLETKNDIEYYDELQRFLAAMNDGHTQMIQRTYRWGEYNDYIPAGVINIEDKVYFSAMRENDGLDLTLIGAEIIEVEDIPIVKYIKEKVYPAISASTEDFRWGEAVSELQRGPKGSFFTGKAVRLTGDTITFSIPRNGETTRTPDEHYKILSQNEKFPRPESVFLEWVDNTAILSIRRFWPDEIKNEIDSVFILIHAKADNLIIDMRNHLGGSTDVGRHLQMYLTQEDYFLSFGSQRRINDSYGRAQGNYREEYEDYYLGKAYRTDLPDTIKKNPDIIPFRKPVVVLMGKRTYSAGEDFLIHLYEVSNRPLFIGEPTGGSTGAPLMVPLPHNAMARICSVRMLYPYSMKPFVKEGIQPDILIKQTLEDYINGRDVVLEKAMLILNDREKL